MECSGDQIGVVEPFGQQRHAAAIDGLARADAEEIVVRRANLDVRRPQQAGIVREALHVAILDHPLAQPLARRLKLYRFLTGVLAGQRHPEIQPGFRQAEQRVEERARVLVILPAVVPHNQRRAVATHRRPVSVEAAQIETRRQHRCLLAE